MLKYIFYTTIHIFIFLFIINKYYEYIINFLLIPINKQNNYKTIDSKIYKNLEYLNFNSDFSNNIYPIFEINFNIQYITYIYYYLIIIYIFIYIIPIILLQSFFF